MAKELYRYRFCQGVSLREAEDDLFLAMLAAEGLYGPARIRLDAAYYMDESIRAIVVDASTPVGQDINGIFVAFLIRQFGQDAFDVKRVEPLPVARAAV